MRKRYIASVVFALGVDKSFDYIIPPALTDKISKFKRVLVEFNRKKRWGIVIGVKYKVPSMKLKPILDILDSESLFDNFYFRWAQILSKKYFVSIGEALELFLVPYLRSVKKIEFSGVPFQRKKKSKFIWEYIFGEKTSFVKKILPYIRKVYNEERQSLVIVPLVEDILPVKKILEKEFSSESISVLYSKQSPKKMFEEWRKARIASSKIVISTRLGIFSILPRLSLVAVDREYHPSYKQREKPYYHLRDVVLLRGKLEKLTVLWGGILPSVEIYKLSKDILKAVSMDKKKIYFVEKWPRKSYKGFFVSCFVDAYIKNSLEDNKKVVILFNRKGYAHLVKCDKCGFYIKCKRCESKMYFYFSQKILVCPYCNYKESFNVDKCPQCGNPYMKFNWWGIEKLYKELVRIFPDKKIVKYQRDLVKDFDILICTQKIFDEEEFEVDVFIILDADTLINFSDFRSSEQVFRLIYKALSFSQQLVIGTSFMHFLPFQYLWKQDVEGFYKKEINLRKKFGLPPYSSIIKLSLRGRTLKTVIKKANQLYEEVLKLPQIEVLPPQPDFPPKLRDKFYYALIVKTKDTKKSLTSLNEILRKISFSSVKLSVDVQ